MGTILGMGCVGGLLLVAWAVCRAAAQLPPVRTREDYEREVAEWDREHEDGAA